MPETVTRPAWVDEIVARFGEPAYDCTEPIPLGDRTRQCWAWSAGGATRNLSLDDLGGCYLARAGGPGRRAELASEQRPTDDEMRTLVAFAWPEAATA